MALAQLQGIEEEQVACYSYSFLTDLFLLVSCFFNESVRLFEEHAFHGTYVEVRQ